jgi:hypothetical protein
MLQLPLGGRVVFVDWHGVLSRDLFWTSILGSATHPLHEALEAKLGEVFSQDAIAHSWMKGTISSQEIIDGMAIYLGRRHPDYLARRLGADCAKMHVNADLMEVLCWLRGTTAIVLATDNMDCFAHAFEQARSRRRRTRQQPQTFEDWVIVWDDIICSSDVGALKSEDPDRFFGTWLRTHGLEFEQALLIDDRADNCEAFRAQGGTTVQWKMGTNDIQEADAEVRRWLGIDEPALAVG